MADVERKSIIRLSSDETVALPLRHFLTRTSPVDVFNAHSCVHGSAVVAHLAKTPR